MADPIASAEAWTSELKVFVRKLLTDQRSDLSRYAVGKAQLPEAAQRIYEGLAGRVGQVEGIRFELGGLLVFGVLSLTDDGEQEGAEIHLFASDGAPLAGGHGSTDFASGTSDQFDFEWVRLGPV